MRNEWRNTFSYTFSFFFSWFLTLVGLGMLYLLPYLTKRSFTFLLDGYSLSFFQYIISGILINMFLVSTTKSFVVRVGQARRIGFFESAINTPTSLVTILVAMYLQRLIFFLCINVPFFLLGIYLLHPAISNFNLGAVVIIFILAQLIYFSLGLLLVSYLFLFENGEFLVNAIFNFFRVFCNIIFPISILPKVFRVISDFIPVSYIFRAFRDALFIGDSLRLRLDIMLLLVFVIIALPFSIWIFHRSVEKVRMWGTLARY